MGMKKHGSKKEGVPLENSKKEPQRLTWKSKYEQICATHVTNGTEENDAKEEDETRSNALDGLSGYLSSDSSSGESELNEEVQNFLKEVDSLYEEDRKQQIANEAIAAQLHAHAQNINKISSDVTMQQYDQSTAPTVAWQECYDSSTGYTYYWNMETNEVTWDMPPEYQTYMEALKQWQQYQAQGVAALLQARVQQQIQQHQMLLQQAHEQQNATKQEAAKTQQSGQKNKKKAEKKSDSEDERIELITSYGPYSDEESSDTEKKASKTPKTKKRKTEDNEQNSKPMGPQLPKNKIRRINRPLQLLKSSLVPYHPENESDTDEQMESSKPSFVEPVPPRVEKDPIDSPNPGPNPVVETRKGEIENIPKDDDDENSLLDRLKCQTQVLKELGGEIPDEVKSIIVDNNDKEEIKLDESIVRSSLSEESKNLKLKLSARAKKLVNLSSTTAKARGTDFLSACDGLKSSIQKKDEGETETVETKKLTRLGIPTSLLSNESGKSTEIKPREEGNRGGFGFVAAKEDKNKTKAERIAFVKADTFHLSEEENKVGAEVLEVVDEESDMDVEDISSVLQDKMRFLSDRKEPVPPVQIWTIQLETLLSAWENKSLKKSYLEDWLNKTRKELETLEGTVAPDGWICEWQRYDPDHQILSTNPSRFPINTQVHSFIVPIPVLSIPVA